MMNRRRLRSRTGGIASRKVSPIARSIFSHVPSVLRIRLLTRHRLEGGRALKNTVSAAKFNHFRMAVCLLQICFRIAFQSKAARSGNGLVCIRDRSLFDESVEKEFRQAFSCFLRDNLFYAGISRMFSGIFALPVYFLQARDALDYGMKESPGLWKFRFTCFVLNYMLEKCRGGYGVEDLYHPSLAVLLEYDRVHPGAKLYETLKQFLHHGFHAARTAEILHLHRTAFLYRMRRIQEPAPLDLEDPDTVFHLLLSFAPA